MTVTWTQFVKEIQKQEGCTYREALSLAKEPWQEYKTKNKVVGKSKPRKEKVREEVVVEQEVVEAPVKKRRAPRKKKVVDDDE